MSNYESLLNMLQQSNSFNTTLSSLSLIIINLNSKCHQIIFSNLHVDDTLFYHEGKLISRNALK